MANMVYRLIGDNELVVVFDYGQPHVITKDNKNFSKVLDLVRTYGNTISDELKDYLLDLMSDKRRIENFIGNHRDLNIDECSITYRGEELHGVLVDRILQLMDHGENVDSLVNFLVKLQSNPSYRVREQLFRFLERGKNAFTTDGDFLAYKKVRRDLKDVHSGTFVNSVGAVLEMPREQVDYDPNRTCSSGLHVCSHEYLSNFGGDVVVCCKVNPRDVVSVPTDYNDSKMRVCRYKVVAILDEPKVRDNYLASKPVVTEFDKCQRSKSSFIKDIRKDYFLDIIDCLNKVYDGLIIEFNNGSKYWYDVEEEVADEFIESDDWSMYYNEFIRHQYDEEKME